MVVQPGKGFGKTGEPLLKALQEGRRGSFDKGVE